MTTPSLKPQKVLIFNTFGIVFWRSANRQQLFRRLPAHCHHFLIGWKVTMLKPLSLNHKHAELLLLTIAAGLLALAVFGPTVTQPAHQHAFADARTWANIPYAMDVLSNAAFALWGAVGLLACYGLRRRKPMHKPMPMYTRKRIHMHTRLRLQLVLAALFFIGLLLTAAASAFYHLQPIDSGLCVDRLGMVVAFAGLLGLANVLPWLVVQFGGMVVVVMVACIKPLGGALQVRWAMVVLVYAVAKVLELADHELYAITNEVVSGHSLKHLVASLAAWPVLSAVRSVNLPAMASANAPAFASVQNAGRIQLTNFDTRAL
jgi:hypothetical protein